MRRLGEELGVEAMSLYHHVKDKDDVLDGVVDLFIGEIGTPSGAATWREAIRERALAAREQVKRHPWVTALITGGRGMRPAMLHYMDWLVGVLRSGGFAPPLVHSAMHLIGARMFGFNEETFSEGVTPAQAQPLMAMLRLGEYPSIAAAIKGMRHDDDYEFAFGLDLVLDGLERARDAQAAPQPATRPRRAS